MIWRTGKIRYNTCNTLVIYTKPNPGHCLLWSHHQVRGTHIPRGDLNKAVMEYLVKEGFKEAALEFQRETGIAPGLDMAVMDQQILIRKSVEEGRVAAAVETVNELDPDILDTDAQLFFHLQLQQLLEYIKVGDIDSALSFAQQELSARGEEHPEFLQELEQALALLAYDEPSTCPFGNLLDHSQRLKVVSELNTAILSSQHKDGTTQLCAAMKLVMWCQQQLEKRNIVFPKMDNITDGCVNQPHPH